MISVVIPNYNGEKLLAKNLPKILEFLEKSKLEFEIIVVDDKSEDNSLGFLRKQKGIRLIEREENGGFPVSADQGIREAKGEIVFVLKNDVVPEKADYFSLVLKHFKDPEVFAVSSAIKTQENGREEIRGTGEIYFEKGLFKHRRGSNEAKISAWPDGGSSAYKRDFYLKIGGFDPVFRPGYWEDVDLGYRAWKAGYKVRFESKAMLLHDFESGVYKKKYGEGQIKLINLRNQIIFTLKNADFKNLILHLAFLILNLRIRNFFKAYLLAMRRLSEIIKSRIGQKQVDKLTDLSVLREFQENSL